MNLRQRLYKIAIKIATPLVYLILGPSPFLYRLYCKHLKPRNDLWVSPFDHPCDLVIEGPGGVAMTAFWNYVASHNPDSHIAHHTHAAASVLHAVRTGTPCLVLARNMMDAIHSRKDRTDQNTWAGLIIQHVMFYLPLLRKRDQFAFADFHDVIAHPCEVVDRINERYGTAFKAEKGPLPKVRTTAFDAVTIHPIEQARQRQRGGSSS